MGYSSLTTYKDFTSNMTKKRNGNKPTYIAIHHMAGCLSVQQCAKVFHTCEVSTHYGIQGKNIGCYVDENNTAWSLGKFDMNTKSINIELSNSSGAPSWKVSDETINTCINLVADIGYRLDWKKISYTGDLSGNIIMHKQISATSCPGPYMIKNNKIKYIADEANKLLQKKRNTKTSKSSTKTSSKTSDKLIVDGNFGIKSCQKMQKWLGSQYRDGIMSGQSKKSAKYISNMAASVEYGNGGSHTVRLLQKKLGKTVDGKLGYSTIKALQKFLKNKGYSIKVDGYAGPATCKAFQQFLNKTV